MIFNLEKAYGNSSLDAGDYFLIFFDINLLAGLAIVESLNDLYSLTCTEFTVCFICRNISLNMCIDQC